jgi:hypothetical protein
MCENAARFERERCPDAAKATARMRENKHNVNRLRLTSTIRLLIEVKMSLPRVGVSGNGTIRSAGGRVKRQEEENPANCPKPFMRVWLEHSLNKAILENPHRVVLINLIVVDVLFILAYFINDRLDFVRGDRNHVGKIRSDVKILINRFFRAP